MAICCLGYKEERPRASELCLGLSKATLSGQGGGQAPLGPPDPALPPVHLRTPPSPSSPHTAQRSLCLPPTHRGCVIRGQRDLFQLPSGWTGTRATP